MFCFHMSRIAFLAYFGYSFAAAPVFYLFICLFIYLHALGLILLFHMCYTYPPSKQCAAVNIHRSLSREPPQYTVRCSIGKMPSNRLVTTLPLRDTNHGVSPRDTVLPPITRFSLERISVPKTGGYLN